MAHGKAILTTLTIFSGIALGWTAGAAAAPPTESSEPPAPTVETAPPTELEPSTEPVYEVVPQLRPPTDECMDQWSAALGEPSQDELSWREQLNHGIYRVGIGERLLARVELLSSASPASCEIDPDWKKRQTQMLITYFLDDGSKQEVLYEFLEDDVFYNQSPQIYAAGGILVLHGVVYDGSDVQVTLELDLLRELYEAALPAAAASERPALRAARALDGVDRPA